MGVAHGKRPLGSSDRMGTTYTRLPFRAMRVPRVQEFGSGPYLTVVTFVIA